MSSTTRVDWGGQHGDQQRRASHEDSTSSGPRRSSPDVVKTQYDVLVLHHLEGKLAALRQLANATAVMPLLPTIQRDCLAAKPHRLVFLHIMPARPHRRPRRDMGSW